MKPTSLLSSDSGLASAPSGDSEPSAACFEFQGRSYRYFAHSYNNTATNERAVEVPLALAALDRCGGPILEVGNVLSHYGVCGHAVVDKYERAEGVLNLDIERFVPDEPFGLVVSISTLEHLGWDEEVQDPGKIARVLTRLTGELLLPDGQLFLTVPMGYNPYLDRLIVRRETGTAIALLRRVSAQNEWRQIDASQVGTPQYGSPFPNGNVVAVLTRGGER